MKTIDRLLIKAQKLKTEKDLKLITVFVTKTSAEGWEVTATLWNNKMGGSSKSERITEQFKTEKEANSFIDEISNKYPNSKHDVPIFVDLGELDGVVN